MTWLAYILGVLGLSCIIANWRLLALELRAAPGERVPSMIPVVGGLMAFAALRLMGRPSAAWLAIVLDPGCYILSLPLIWAARRRSS